MCIFLEEKTNILCLVALAWLRSTNDVQSECTKRGYKGSVQIENTKQVHKLRIQSKWTNSALGVKQWTRNWRSPSSFLTLTADHNTALILRQKMTIPRQLHRCLLAHFQHEFSLLSDASVVSVWPCSWCLSIWQLCLLCWHCHRHLRIHWSCCCSCDLAIFETN
jgi:hypothetical protein